LLHWHTSTRVSPGPLPSVATPRQLQKTLSSGPSATPGGPPQALSLARIQPSRRPPPRREVPPIFELSESPLPETCPARAGRLGVTDSDALLALAAAAHAAAPRHSQRPCSLTGGSPLSPQRRLRLSGVVEVRRPATDQRRKQAPGTRCQTPA
jgi:hypothetical protein